MTRRPFEARYRGRCDECPDLIEVGDSIVWLDDGTGAVAHEGCAERGGQQPSRPETPCPSCWLVHAGECA